MEERTSATPRSSDSSGSEVEKKDEVKDTEDYVVKAPVDANHRTPEVDPSIGSPLSAAPARSVQRHDSVPYKNFCGDGRRVNAHRQMPKAGWSAEPLKSARLSPPPRRTTKDIVIWNTNYRHEPDTNDDDRYDRSPDRSVQSNYRQPRRAGFWSSGSDAPSWRVRH